MNMETNLFMIQKNFNKKGRRGGDERRMGLGNTKQFSEICLFSSDVFPQSGLQSLVPPTV